MQTQTTLKQFALNHLWSTALAFGILVGSLSVAATLSATGEFPSLGSDGPASVTDSGVTTRVTAAVAEQRQLQMERDDYYSWQRSRAQSGVASVVTTRVGVTDAERRQLKMEREEFYAWRQSHAGR